MENDGRKEGKENKKDSIICRSSITGTVFNGVRQFWALLMFKVFLVCDSEVRICLYIHK